MNYKEINHLFFEMEVKYDLFLKEIDHIYFWKLIRIHVYNDVVGATLGNGNPHPNAFVHSIFERVISKLRIYYVKIFNRVEIPTINTEVLVFKHRRRINVEGEFVEVNTDYLDLTDYTKGRKTQSVDTDIAFDNRNINKNIHNFLIPSPHAILYYRIKNNKILKQNEEVIHEINSIIKCIFGVTLNIKKHLERELAGYKVHYHMASRFLKKSKIREVIVVVSYGKEGIIQAAKDLGIMTSEIQHGVINKYHLGYSFPQGIPLEQIKYFPHNVLLYGDFWVNAASYPVQSKDNLISIGSPYFDLQYKKYKQLEKEPKSIIFVSDGQIGGKLSEIAYSVAIKLKNYHIYYKLHPSEFSIWKDIYSTLMDPKMTNLEVVEDNINIFELYAKCKYLVGVNSTTIYESFGFDVKVILYNLPGVEEMQVVIDKYDIPVANDTEEVIGMIINYPINIRIASEQFYKKVCR